MLRTEDFLREFPINSRTDRDAEVPMLLDFVKPKVPIGRLLDVGAHYSSHHYAPELRKYVTEYHGIDILDDLETKKILDTYIVGNANEYFENQFNLYDMVICVSTIEHAGVSTYKREDVKEEQQRLFETCLRLASKYLWISFPLGQEYVYPNEFSMITEKQLKRWETITNNFKVKERFLYNQGSQAGYPWHEHNKRNVAVKIPYIDFIGNQSTCILEIEK